MSAKGDFCPLYCAAEVVLGVSGFKVQFRVSGSGFKV